MRSVLGGTSPEHTLCLLCCEYDQLPTALEHTSMGFPGPHMLPGGAAEQRSAVYSSNVSTSRLDTAQMAMIRYTLTFTSATSGSAAFTNALEEAFGV
jgi:hypothetical protein